MRTQSNIEIAPITTLADLGIEGGVSRMELAVKAVELQVGEGYAFTEAVACQAAHFGVHYRGLLEYFRE